LTAMQHRIDRQHDALQKAQDNDGEGERATELKPDGTDALRYKQRQAQIDALAKQSDAIDKQLEGGDEAASEGQTVKAGTRVKNPKTGQTGVIESDMPLPDGWQVAP
jgi:hypothetical protein